MNKLILFSISIIILLISCHQNEAIDADIPTITFDTSKKSPLSAKDIECTFVPLETNDSCLLSTIIDIQIYENKIFLIDGIGNSKVFVFDLTGKFITQIGKTGDGPGGYIMPVKLFIDNEKSRISLADANSNQLLHYDLDSYKFINSQKAFNFTQCCKLENNNILWYDIQGFDTKKRKRYHIKITDSDLNHIQYLSEADINSPFGINVFTLYNYRGNVILNFPYQPYLYKLSGTDLKKIFKISFGKQNLPNEEWLSEVKPNDRNWVTRLLASNLINSYSIIETDKHLGITFYEKDFYSNLGFFDKESLRSVAFNKDQFTKQFQINGARAIIGQYNNLFIMQLEAKSLKKETIQRSDLAEIAASLNEESNPVLCLFKFKNL